MALVKYAGWDDEERHFHLTPRRRRRRRCDLRGMSLEEAVEKGQRKGMTLREIHRASDFPLSQIETHVSLWLRRVV